MITIFFMGSVWPAIYYYSLLETFHLQQILFPLGFGPLLCLSTASWPASPLLLAEACVSFLDLLRFSQQPAIQAFVTVNNTVRM